MQSSQFKLISFSLVIAAQFLMGAYVSAAARVDEGVFVLDPSKTQLRQLAKDKTLTIDHVRDEGFEVYGPVGTIEKLQSAQIPMIELEAVYGNMQSKSKGYPTHEQITARLRDIEIRCPSIMKLTSIGQSVEGRDLWVMKVSKDPTTDSSKPEVKYISSMHGDEITGRELLQNFLEDICGKYSKDPSVTEMVDNLEIYIMPSMNPDGSARPRRANARGYDLNRDFPDFEDRDSNTSDGRQIETQHIMRFQAERNFVLSANFHGGAEVVNYPWDTTRARHPEDSLMKEVSLLYAGLAPYLASSNEFPRGITNGYDWYEVDGGMQDWSNYWYRDLQVTIELSNDKWPDYSMIPFYWEQNRAALYAYLKRAMIGAGFNMNSSNKGSVKISKLLSHQDALSEVGVFPFEKGEFYKVLEEGRYRFDVSFEDKSLQEQSFVTEVKGLLPYESAKLNVKKISTRAKN